MKQNKKLTLLYFELCSPTDGGERGSEPIFSGLYAYHIPIGVASGGTTVL
jgi:hypothetical protein